MQNTGIAAVAPQGAQQAAPSIPQEMQPRPQGGVSTGIAPPMGNLDKRTLAMAVLGQVPGVEPAAALGRLNKLVEAEKMQQAMAGQQAMAQNSAMQQQPPVAQQVLAQAMNSGIGAQPYGYAGGGLVAFADGGGVGYGFADPVAGAEAMALDELRVQRQDELSKLAYPPDAQEWQRLGMKYGIILSPYASEEERVQKIKEIKDRVAAQRAADPAARVGTEKGRASNPNQVTYTPPAQVAPKPPVPPAPPAPPRTGVSPRAATPVTPAAPNALDTANQQYLESLGKSADLTPEERSAREQLRRQLEELQKARMGRQEKLEADLAARRAAMGKRPSGFQDPDFLLKLAAAMGSTKTASEGFAKASEAISGYGAQRRKEQEDMAREMRREEMDLMKLRDANEDLKTALYEKDLAYASGDANAKRAADLKVAEARANQQKAKQDYELEKYKAESGRKTAEAALASAAARGEARNTLTPRELAQIRDRARDNITKDKDYQRKVMDARSQARKQGVVFDEEAWLNQRVEAEVNRQLGLEQPPSKNPNEKVYDFTKIGPK